MDSVGKNMLLPSGNRMRIICIFSLIVLGFCTESIGADMSTGEDIVLKNNKGDILTSPSKKINKTATVNRESAIAASKADVVATINKHIARVSQILGNTDNTLDIYMGNCRHVSNSLSEAKAFLLKHKDLKTRFYNLKTDDATSLSQADIGGLEIMPATEAKKYNVNHVPTYIFHVNGRVFKVSGDTSLEDVYQDIIHNKFDGEKADGFLDAGAKGPGCPAYIPEFGISALTEQQKEMIDKETTPPAAVNIALPDPINIQEYDKTQTISKKIASSEYMEFKKYIVFSVNQKEWAKKMIAEKAVGCCTNCGISGIRREFGPYIQVCSQDMLDALGVTGVPTIVHLQ